MRDISVSISLSSIKPRHVIITASCLAVLVTVISIAELQGLISKADQQGHGAFLPTHTDWATLSAVAHKAVAHVEHLPTIQGHGFPLHPLHPDSGLVTQPASAQEASSPSGASPPSPSPSPETKKDEKPLKSECNAKKNTELWGDVVKWGSSFKVDSAAECCDACLNFKTDSATADKCNVWVYCDDPVLCHGQHKECWLKHLVHPEAAKPAREGPDVGWVAGVCGDTVAAVEVDPTKIKDPRRFHIVTSAQGAAVQWQTRVHYYWYKKQRAECEKMPNCEMGGFTRLLHSGEPDELMDEIPTFVADPLPDSVVEHSWYPVLNRPYAFVQWVQKATIKEKYVLMSEPDHIMLRPIPNFMRHEHPAAFPFFYIEPSKDENLPLIARHLGIPSLSKKDSEAIAPIGNSPSFLTWEQMKEAMPIWQNMSIAIFQDQETNKKWGWVQEMYAFTITLYKIGIRHVDLALHLQAQPPWDSALQISPSKPYYILHYTYGCDYNMNGEFTPGKYGYWRFDKRTYAQKPPPRHLGAPPKGVKNDMVRKLIDSINEATANIECWDQYYTTGKVAPCDEKLPNSVYYKKFDT